LALLLAQPAVALAQDTPQKGKDLSKSTRGRGGGGGPNSNGQGMNSVIRQQEKDQTKAQQNQAPKQ
jgi:hypothetical protein